MARPKSDEQLLKKSGNRLSREMKSRRVSSKELAIAVGLNPVQISYIRTGVRPMAEDVAEKIAEYLSQKPVLTGDYSPEEMKDIVEQIAAIEESGNLDDQETEKQLRRLKRKKEKNEKERLVSLTPGYLLGKTGNELPIKEDTPEEKAIELWGAIKHILQCCGYELQQASDVPLIKDGAYVDWSDEHWQKAEKNYEAIIKKEGAEKIYHLTPSEQYTLFLQIYRGAQNTIENFFAAKDIAEHFKK